MKTGKMVVCRFVRWTVALVLIVVAGAAWALSTAVDAPSVGRVTLDCERFGSCRINAAQSHDIIVEAEAFAEKGGWVTDTQFMDQMESPFLLAHGLGQPVADAKTTFDAGAGGRRIVYVRTRNWNAPWSSHSAGRFRVSVNGTVSPVLPRLYSRCQVEKASP